MCILVTGFEPFGGAQTNPSWEAVKLLPPCIGGMPVHTLQLPVTYGQSGDLLMAEIRRLRPHLVICCGVAAGRTAVTPELVAVNWRMASIADNAGVAYTGEKIRPDGPAAYMTALPLTDMIATLQAGDLPGRISLSAGSYVCNDLYYRLLAEEKEYRGLFIHVPGEDVLPPQKAAQALRLCIETALRRA